MQHAGLKKGEAGKLAISLLIPQAVGWAGALFARSAIPAWYATLSKPPLNPPSWVFGPVWTVLYLFMGIALFLVWRKAWGSKTARPLFIIQLVLNGIWTPVFFGLHALLPALAIIALLDAAVALTIMSFMKVNKRAALLLLPYLAWITFATYLNASIWALN